MNANDKWQKAFEHPIPEWDQEEVWADIEQSLEKKRRRFPFFWWLVFVFAVLVTAFAYLYNVVDTSSNPSDPSIQFITKQVEADIAQQGIANPLEPSIDLAPAIERKRPLESHKLEVNPEQKRNHGTPKLVNSSVALAAISTPIIEPIQGLHVEFEAQSTVATPPILEFALLTSYPKAVLSTKPFGRVHLPYVTILDSESKPTPKGKRAQTIEMMTSLSFTIRNTKAAGDKNIHANLKRQSEEPLETFQTAALYQFSLGKHWGFGTGILYQRTNQWFRYDDIKIKEIQISSDSATYYSFNGNNYYEPGLVTQTTTTTRKIESPAKLERFSIPIQVEWAGFWGKNGIRINGGALWNIHNTFQGFSLDDSSQLMEKGSPLWREIYRTEGVHSLYSSIQYTRVIHPKWLLGAGIRWQADIRNTLSQNTGISQRDQLVGTTLSLRYLLSKARF